MTAQVPMEIEIVQGVEVRPAELQPHVTEEGPLELRMASREASSGDPSSSSGGRAVKPEKESVPVAQEDMLAAPCSL
jgi:hypothetical protein